MDTIKFFLLSTLILTLVCCANPVKNDNEYMEDLKGIWKTELFQTSDKEDTCFTFSFNDSLCSRFLSVEEFPYLVKEDTIVIQAQHDIQAHDGTPIEVEDLEFKITKLTSDSLVLKPVSVMAKLIVKIYRPDNFKLIRLKKF